MIDWDILATRLGKLRDHHGKLREPAIAAMGLRQANLPDLEEFAVSIAKAVA